jgi:hypothetical protein
MKGLVLKIILCLQKITCSHVFAIEPAVFSTLEQSNMQSKTDFIPQTSVSLYDEKNISSRNAHQ